MKQITQDQSLLIEVPQDIDLSDFDDYGMELDQDLLRKLRFSTLSSRDV